MPNASLLAAYVAALDAADRVAEDLIVLEADALAEGADADLEQANAEWDAVLARYWTGNDVEDRFRARLLIESLAMYGARALRRVQAHAVAA